AQRHWLRDPARQARRPGAPDLAGARPQARRGARAAARAAVCAPGGALGVMSAAPTRALAPEAGGHNRRRRQATLAKRVAGAGGRHACTALIRRPPRARTCPECIRPTVCYDVKLRVAFSLNHYKWSTGLRWAVAFFASALFFVSIAVHEISHALVGRSQGIAVPRITLFVFGGMAHAEGEPRSARAE